MSIIKLTRRHLCYGSHHKAEQSAVFNMTTALNCPSYKLGYCQVIVQDKCYCYSRISEQRSQVVLAYHQEQSRLWDKLTAKDFVEQFIEINAQRRKRWTELEFNDAGDFRSQADVRKADIIAKFLKKNHTLNLRGISMPYD